MDKSEQAAFREEEIHAKQLTGKIMIWFFPLPP